MQEEVYLLEELTVLCFVNGWQLCPNELNVVFLQDSLLQKDRPQ